MPRHFPPVYRIYLAAFLLDGALMVGITALPFFVYHHLGGSTTHTGAIGSAQALVYAGFCLGSSLVVARIRNGMALAVAGAAIFATLFSFSHFSGNLVLYSIGVSVANLGMALVWPALHSWLGAERNTRLRTRRMGAFNIAWSMGLAVGPLLGGALYEIDYRLPFIAVFAMGAVSALLLWTVPPETPHVPEPETPEVDRHERASLERLILSAWVANGLGWALVIVTRMVFPKRVDELVDANALRILFESDPPLLLTYGAARLYSVPAFLLSFASCAVFVLMGRTHWWHGRFWVLAVLQVLAAGSIWVLGATHSYAVMLGCFALVGINCGACFFASTFYCTADPAQKHRRLAVNEGIVGLGGFVAPLGFGWLADTRGMAASFQWAPALVGALLLAQAGLLLWARSERRV
jgi:MFS family permease